MLKVNGIRQRLIGNLNQDIQNFEQLEERMKKIEEEFTHIESTVLKVFCFFEKIKKH